VEDIIGGLIRSHQAETIKKNGSGQEALTLLLSGVEPFLWKIFLSHGKNNLQLSKKSFFYGSTKRSGGGFLSDIIGRKQKAGGR